MFNYPIVLEHEAEVSIFLAAKLFKSTRDMEVWTWDIPNNGVQLTVRYPNKIKCKASAIHSKPLEEIVSREGITWLLPYGLFPHQGIVIWWRPSENES
jgi:hypothetical protein